MDMRCCLLVESDGDQWNNEQREEFSFAELEESILLDDQRWNRQFFFI